MKTYKIVLREIREHVIVKDFDSPLEAQAFAESFPAYCENDCAGAIEQIGWYAEGCHETVEVGSVTPLTAV